MATEQEINQKLEVTKSLERIQKFNTAILPRTEVLGTEMNFEQAVEPANKVIRLFNQISVDVIDDLTNIELTNIKNQADSFFNNLTQVLEFSTRDTNSNERRNSILNNISVTYNTIFPILHPIISYSTSKVTDFSRLESESRATLQNIKDRNDELTSQLEENRKEVEEILQQVRETAAEQGVSQQAHYYREESEEHATKSNNWLKLTFWAAGFMAIYTIFSLFIHKIPLLTPQTAYENIQLGISKTLIFAVISYILYLSSKNFLAHKHNSIVNKHRQNALMTYTALLDAASQSENKDIILTYAASCIFEPQSTGYSKEKNSDTIGTKSVVELLAKPFSSDD